MGKLLFPAVKRYLIPAAASFSSGVIKDMGAGKKFKESVKHRGIKSLKKMGTRIMSGKGVKSKKVAISRKERKRTNGRKKGDSIKRKRVGCGIKKKNRGKTKSKKKNGKQKSKSYKRKYSDIFSQI